ncbi:MAG TPA: NUDIX hydrolase [Streptosporangiaceae bacterium]|jgi:8-oxo-dGTP diphosphatase|nr:NUDIX hydrolase [Streptosporangiaceae bacterium]
MKRERTRSGPAAETLLLAAAVVLHYGRVLIVQRSAMENFLPSVWGVPCGKLDDGEEPQHAVLRELHEETGLAGTVVRYAGEQTFRSVWRGRPVENQQSNFLVGLNGAGGDEFPQVCTPDPKQGWEWLPIDKIDSFGLDEHNLTAIHQGLAVAWAVSSPGRPAP